MGWEVPYLGNFEAWRGFLKGKGEEIRKVGPTAEASRVQSYKRLKNQIQQITKISNT
jgi:hypothetical protein